MSRESRKILGSDCSGKWEMLNTTGLNYGPLIFGPNLIGPIVRLPVIVEPSNKHWALLLSNFPHKVVGVFVSDSFLFYRIKNEEKLIILTIFEPFIDYHIWCHLREF